MRHILLGLTLISLFLFPQCSENKVEVSDAQLVNMRSTSVDFMKELKGILIEQIQTGGVVQAVAVCSDTAQVLSNEFGRERGVYIKRVSLKNRNEINHPDDFEKRVLREFEFLHQNNELNNETEFAEIITEGNYKYLRYLKPILIQAECLNCHGNKSEMMPEVRNLVAQKYPKDEATGYKTGELRGAISIKKVIE